MRWLLAITLLAFACENEARDPASSETTAPQTTVPAGVAPKDHGAFGQVAVDVDRVTLVERTVLVLDDAGIPTGDDAHPESYETTDERWIRSFVRAVGPETRPTDLDATKCAPWADLTMYRGDEAVVSFPVGCSAETFSTFRVRGSETAFEGKDVESLDALLQQLR